MPIPTIVRNYDAVLLSCFASLFVLPSAVFFIAFFFTDYHPLFAPFLCIGVLIMVLSMIFYVVFNYEEGHLASIKKD